MKTNLLLSFLLVTSHYCFAQDGAKDETKASGNVVAEVQPDQNVLDMEQEVTKAVEEYYYEQIGIKDFFKKYPDYPRYINTGDPNHGPSDYEDRVIKWIVNQPDLMKILEKHPYFKELVENALLPRSK